MPARQRPVPSRAASRNSGRSAGPGSSARLPPAPAEVGEFAGRVLDVVDAIPPGMVMSYGDVAEYLGAGGPRQVGRVMALWGGGVPWWRVIRADGSPPPGHERAALARYREEGTPVRAGADGRPARVDMRRARWDGPARHRA